MDIFDNDGNRIEPRKNGLWSKIGGGPLMFAALVHLVLLVFGAYWVFQTLSEPEKKVDFLPPAGGGGGERGAEHQVQQKKRAQITPSTSVKRVFAEGAKATYSIPEQGDNFGELASLNSLTAASSGGGGLGGSGTGKGAGTGSGVGAGTGGLIGGTGSKNPFGFIDPKNQALTGTLYDLKQTRAGKPTEFDDNKMREAAQTIWKKEFSEGSLRDFYQAPQKLSQTRIFFPRIGATEAPKAFGCEKEVEPKRWIAIYRGAVKAPATGKFRFVGAMDDILAIRFNGKRVFDYGYTNTSIAENIFMPGPLAIKSGKTEDKEMIKKFRDNSPMEFPFILYPYKGIPDISKDVGGFAAGKTFEVKEGDSYPIEIMIGEVPGGLFGGFLMIEQIGVEYKKDELGSPILPIFRLDNSLPEIKPGDQVPPFDPNGSIWRPGSSGKYTPGI